MSTSALKWQRPLILAGSLILIIASLYLAQPVFIPIVFSILLTFLLSPVVAALQRRGLNRAFSVIGVALLTFSLLAGVVWAVGVQLADLAVNIPQYEDNIKQKVKALRQASAGGVIEKIQESIKGINREMNAPPKVADETETSDPGSVAPLPIPPVPVQQVDEKSAANDWWQIASPLTAMLEPLASVGLVIILVIFMLLRREDMRNRLICLIGSSRLTLTTKALDDAGQRISRYLLMQLIVNGSMGVAVGIGLFFIGVPYAFLWGFLAALLRYIPYLGPWLAAILPIGLSFITSEGWFAPLAVVGLFLVLELISNNVMEPLLYGQTIGVSEVALLIAMAFWTWLWGPIGLILATPLTVCIVVLGKYVPHLEFINILMGDEQVMDPQHSFYQRLLAKDQDEAMDLLEEYVQMHSLAEAYDELLIPVLTFCLHDRERDDLSADDERLIYRSIRNMIEQLDDDTTKVEFSRNGSAQALLLGLPARKDADELALLMLQRLLSAKDYEWKTASADMLSSEMVTLAGQDSPALIIVGSLPPGGLAQTRYLCKRIRNQFPDVRMVVGRWGLQGNLERNNDLLMKAGADDVGTTLADSINQIAQRVHLEPVGLPA